MRIATWNIKGARARKGHLLRWLGERKPDVVALQKILVTEAGFPTEELKSAGYRSRALCAKGEHGVALLSRSKFIVAHDQAAAEKELGPRLLTVEVDGLEFSSVYAPYGEVKDIGRGLCWLERLTDHVSRPTFRSDQRILCGDFNVSTECRGDTGGEWTRDARLRGKFQAFLALGFHDLYMNAHSDAMDPFICEEEACTFKVSKLEYILGTSCVLQRLRDIYVDIGYRIPSRGIFPWECAPVVADLDD